ncbi:MAG: calcium-binding protein [Pseudomonadota bacterium]
MSEQPNITSVIGSGLSEILTGTSNADLLIGLAGDDTINGGAGNDEIAGDFSGANLLALPEAALTLSQLGNDDSWTVASNGQGDVTASQTVATREGTSYTLSLDLAANLASGAASGAIIVFWNGVEVGRFDADGAEFDAQELQVQGTGNDDLLTLQTAEGAGGDGPTILFDGPVPSYERTFEIDGQSQIVRAFAPGQANFYQVMESILHAFDPATSTYQAIGSAAGHVYNGMGFNTEDDLLYAIATSAGVDSLGNAVAKSNVVTIDAEGQTYVIGDAPYASWVGDFDGQGNLWTFDSDMDHISRIDVSELAAGNADAIDVWKFPKDMVTDKVLDVAYDEANQRFMGVARPAAEGDIGKLLIVDVSGVVEGGDPVFSTVDLAETLVGDVIQQGIPKMTFGAAFLDVDGNLYVGGNNGDHDMENATANSGGIYQVVLDPDTGTARLELVADAQAVRNNDGAADPRAISGTSVIEDDAPVLIRNPTLVEAPDPEDTFDDMLYGEAGQDTASGGLGEDVLIGGSRGDVLDGGDAMDVLFGGAGPNSGSGIISVYDDQGRRFDQFGNLLAEDDDVLTGGAGNDTLDGSAGHDALFGGADDDLLTAGSGMDQLFGGSGNDALFGGSEADALFGGTGDDTMSGGSGDDALAGGLGNDTATAGSGNDTLDGGAGADELSGGSGDDVLTGGDGDDKLDGASGNDAASGGFGVDRLFGGSGNDTLDGDAGNDQLDGGAGNDTISGGDGADRLKGGSGDDVMTGGAGKDYLAGGLGNDIMAGGADRDFLRGGTGADVMTGGGGSDRFAFRLADLDGSTDVITDLTRKASELDQIDLSDLDLLAGGQSAVDWAAQNLTQSADFTVTLILGSGVIELIDSSNHEDAFADHVFDALIF